MQRPHLLNGAAVRRLVVELAEALGANDHRELVIAGGSLLALHGLRDSTIDVDSLTPLDETLRNHIAQIAAQHGLRTDWLNDHALPFRPLGLRPEECDVLLEHLGLRLLGVPLPQLFLMKLDRAQEQDVADLVRLWPIVSSAFRSVSQIVHEYLAAYPNAREDPFLEQFLHDVARRSHLRN